MTHQEPTQQADPTTALAAIQARADAATELARLQYITGELKTIAEQHQAENQRLRVLIDPDNEQAVRRVALWLSGWGDDEFENWERIRNPLVGRYLGDAKTVLRCLRDAANGEG